MRWLTGLFLVCAALLAGARAQAQAACCSITAIDAKTEVVTAKVNASGAEFQFRVANANLLKGLRVGQGVYANLTAKQLSLDGKSACCTIVSTPAAAPLRPPCNSLTSSRHGAFRRGSVLYRHSGEFFQPDHGAEFHGSVFYFFVERQFAPSCLRERKPESVCQLHDQAGVARRNIGCGHNQVSLPHSAKPTVSRECCHVPGDHDQRSRWLPGPDGNHLRSGIV